MMDARPTIDDLAALEAAEAMAPHKSRRSTWFECGLLRAQWIAPADGTQLADRIDQQATALGMLGFARSAHPLVVSCRLADGQAQQALLGVARADALGDEIVPAGMEQAHAQLIACRVLLATQQPQAPERPKKAVSALRRRAERHVPAPLRDSYLHRNPVNRELLALASRHGIGLADTT